MPAPSYDDVNPHRKVPPEQQTYGNLQDKHIAEQRAKLDKITDLAMDLIGDPSPWRRDIGVHLMSVILNREHVTAIASHYDPTYIPAEAKSISRKDIDAIRDDSDEHWRQYCVAMGTIQHPDANIAFREGFHRALQIIDQIWCRKP